MSAGTVLVLSGDIIYMDYFSCLGPIDPQIVRNGIFVPALSYHRQYQALVRKSEQGPLSSADLVLLSKLDLAELDWIQLNAQLSVSLITDWLSRYKFKDWKRNGKLVSKEEKEGRAAEIARMLNDQEKWFVHGHRIHKDTLEKDLRLKIDDYSDDPMLKSLIWKYFWPALEVAEGHSFVHSRGFL